METEKKPITNNSDAIDFATWMEDNGWVCVYSEELRKRAYIDSSNNAVLTFGSDYHFTKLIKEAGKTIEEVYKIFKLNK